MFNFLYLFCINIRLKMNDSSFIQYTVHKFLSSSFALIWGSFNHKIKYLLLTYTKIKSLKSYPLLTISNRRYIYIITYKYPPVLYIFKYFQLVLSKQFYFLTLMSSIIYFGERPLDQRVRKFLLQFFKIENKKNLI